MASANKSCHPARKFNEESDASPCPFGNGRLQDLPDLWARLLQIAGTQCTKLYSTVGRMHLTLHHDKGPYSSHWTLPDLTPTALQGPSSTSFSLNPPMPVSCANVLTVPCAAFIYNRAGHLGRRTLRPARLKILIIWPFTKKTVHPPWHGEDV